MDRKQFQELAKVRIREAEILLDNGQFDGSHYLSGYAIECAIKACIAKATKRHEFPDKGKAEKSWDHNLVKLLKVAGLNHALDKKTKTDVRFKVNWQCVERWKVEDRYIINKSKAEAEDLYNAVSKRGYGVLSWLKKYW